eukprot:scaffold93291_cov57-Phaeocystis_antarctica.AAC.2
MAHQLHAAEAPSPNGPQWGEYIEPRGLRLDWRARRGASSSSGGGGGAQVQVEGAQRGGERGYKSLGSLCSLCSMTRGRQGRQGRQGWRLGDQVRALPCRGQQSGSSSSGAGAGAGALGSLQRAARAAIAARPAREAPCRGSRLPHRDSTWSSWASHLSWSAVRARSMVRACRPPGKLT